MVENRVRDYVQMSKEGDVHTLRLLRGRFRYLFHNVGVLDKGGRLHSFIHLHSSFSTFTYFHLAHFLSHLPENLLIAIIHAASPPHT